MLRFHHVAQSRAAGPVRMSSGAGQAPL